MKTSFAVILIVAAAGTAHAQSLTTGAVEGRVTDEKTGDPLAGITVWATGPSDEPQTAMTDADGAYKITELIPGEYTIQFFVDERTITRKKIGVTPNNVTPVFQKVKPIGSDTAGPGSIIEIFDIPPQIDPTTHDLKKKFDRAFMEKIPTPSRDFIGAAATTPGAHNDGLGVAIAGATSIENRYLVDGVDITGLTYGTIGTPVLSEFIEETEVISGGYNAEWGRAIGGIINVITKSGSNKFRGSVFGTISPGFLARSALSTPVNASSIDVEANRAYSGDFGFEISGPIIKDRLFFFVGLAPQLSRTDYRRITKRQTDCRQRLPNGDLSVCDPRLPGQGGFADGAPDVDPETGFYITDALETETRSAWSRQYTGLAKLNLAITPKDQAQISVIAVPDHGETPGLYGLPSTGGRSSGLTTDVAARWTSKLDDDKTEVEAIIAWHRSTANSGSIDPSLDDQPRQILRDGNLGLWSGLGGESARSALGCTDGGADDPYASITNCPMNSISYSIGGPGAITADVEDRRLARTTITHRMKLLGSHEMRAGIDFEQDATQTARLYSGGAFIQNSVGAGQVDVTRWVQLAPLDNKDPRFDQTCSTPDPNASMGVPGTKTFACDFISGTRGAPGTTIEGETINWAAFVRDSWRPWTNLSLNAGVRYEEQRLRYASNLRHTVDALTGNRFGKNAMTLEANWAPRFGVIWDPTDEGKAKVFGAWGRFFEAIPMDINDRSFGGEVSYQQTFNAGTGQPCGPSDPRIGGPNGVGCLTPNAPPSEERLIGSSGVLVAPGIGAQYMDEALGGLEYQVAEDLKLGITFQHRRLGRVIEDVSTDGAQTYLIANPGEWSKSEEDALEHRIARTDDLVTRRRLENQLRLYKGIRMFDKPQRSYDSLEISLAKRLSRGLFVQGSYTRARASGNYPGLISYDNGQVDPNISSQYDLIELLANRRGLLPQDRPHSFKVDGHYTFDLGKRDALTFGSRVRMLSGTPTSALGAHYLYGPDESFLLPRGIMGRSEIEHSIDLHVGYARKISANVKAELFVDLFNLYNNQGTFATDQTYAPALRRATATGGASAENNVNPIVGGEYEDLMWAKMIDGQGNETQIPTARNPNFGKTMSRYAPTSARIGFRITF